MDKTEIIDRVQRFFQVLGKGLKIRLETTVRKDDLKSLYGLSSEIKDSLALDLIKENLPEGFSIRDPNVKGNKPDAKTFSLFHPAKIKGVDLDVSVLLPITENEPPLTLNFSKPPDGLPILFQRINLKQDLHDQLVIGIIHGRHGEEKHFPNQDRNGNPFVNLDCFSKTKEWNPLFVKYHLAVAPALKSKGFGYLKIDIQKDEAEVITVVVSRVSETAVPEFLKTAQTYPK